MGECGGSRINLSNVSSVSSRPKEMSVARSGIPLSYDAAVSVVSGIAASSSSDSRARPGVALRGLLNWLVIYRPGPPCSNNLRDRWTTACCGPAAFGGLPTATDGGGSRSRRRSRRMQSPPDDSDFSGRIPMLGTGSEVVNGPSGEQPGAAAFIVLPQAGTTAVSNRHAPGRRTGWAQQVRRFTEPPGPDVSRETSGRPRPSFRRSAAWPELPLVEGTGPR